VDSDIGFEPEQVFRLLEFDSDIVAAIYPSKRLDLKKLKLLVLEGETRLETASLSYAFEVDDPEHVVIRDGFAKVRYAGTGFMLVKRSVFLSLAERHPELAYSNAFVMGDPLGQSRHRFAFFNCILDKENGVYLSEDYSFCRRWTDMGGEIWVDLQSRLKHVGPLIFDGDFSSQLRQTPT
jgi:hypothetical protein